MQATVFKHSSHVAIQHGNIQKRRYQTEYTWGASKQNNKILSLRAFWNIPCRMQSGKADASLFLSVSPWKRWSPYSPVCIHCTVCHRRTTSGKVKGQKYYKCLLLLSTLRFYSYLQLHTQINTLLYFKMSDNTILYFIFFSLTTNVVWKYPKSETMKPDLCGLRLLKSTVRGFFSNESESESENASKGQQRRESAFLSFRNLFFPFSLDKAKNPLQKGIIHS